MSNGWPEGRHFPSGPQGSTPGKTGAGRCPQGDLTRFSPEFSRRLSASTDASQTTGRRWRVLAWGALQPVPAPGHISPADPWPPFGRFQLRAVKLRASRAFHLVKPGKCAEDIYAPGPHPHRVPGYQGSALFSFFHSEDGEKRCPKVCTQEKGGGMNQREARAIQAAHDRLVHGPGNGWAEILQEAVDGHSDFHGDSTASEREARLLNWLGSWVLPALIGPATRYGRGRKTRFE